MEKRKILFLYRYSSTFVENDYKTLKKHFSVERMQIKWSLKDFIKLFYRARENDLIFVWFANWVAFLSIIFSKFWGKKSVVIAGGMDAMWFIKNKKIKNLEVYGLFEKIQKLISQFVFNHADFLLPVSKYAERGVMIISKPKRIKTVYNGVEPIKVGKIKKKEIVMIVAPLVKINIRKKGLITFAKASKLVPHAKFFIIGRYNENSSFYHLLLNVSGKNLEFTGYIERNKLCEIMKEAKVYCQVSYSESFGYALAEAMLYKCIPVVTNRTALPEIVGDTGFYVNYGDVISTAKAIKKALKMPDSFGETPRKRILENFLISKREKDLINVVRLIGDLNE